VRSCWPFVSGSVPCTKIADAEVLLRVIAGQLEREGVSELKTRGKCLYFSLRFPLLVTLTLSSWVGSGRISVVGCAEGLSIGYRFSWFRALACSLLVVSMLFLATAILAVDRSIVPYEVYVMCAAFTALIAYAGARIAARGFVRACVRHAGIAGTGCGL